MSPRRPVPERKKSGPPPWLIVAGIAAVAVLAVIVAADFMTKVNTPPPVTMTGDVPRSGRTEGYPNAPINFVEFSDFQ